MKKPPTTWQEMFYQTRSFAFRSKSLGLPKPFEATGHYLERLERCILRHWRPGELIPFEETLPYGVLLGDVLAKRFGGKWQYTAFAFPQLLLDNRVVMVDRTGADMVTVPFRTIGKFVANPNHTLTAVYDMCEAVLEGRLTIDDLQPDKPIDVSPETGAWVVDEHGQPL
jgi:hypothetical protein